jgi:hypothetical protein
MAGFWAVRKKRAYARFLRTARKPDVNLGLPDPETRFLPQAGNFEILTLGFFCTCLRRGARRNSDEP